LGILPRVASHCQNKAFRGELQAKDSVRLVPISRKCYCDTNFPKANFSFSKAAPSNPFYSNPSENLLSPMENVNKL